MTKPTDMPEPSGSIPFQFNEVGSAIAPTLYFEDAPVFGQASGVFKITLTETRSFCNEPGKVVNEVSVVAHLRMSITAAHALKNAIEKALLLAAPPASEEKN